MYWWLEVINFYYLYRIPFWYLNSRLNLSWRKSSSFVKSNKLRSFSSNSIKSIMNERIHDVHGFLWDTNVWVYLLEDFVNVDGEGLNSSSSSFLVSFRGGFGGGFGFFSHLFNLIISLLEIIEISSFNIQTVGIFNFDWLKNIHKKIWREK